jgi:hypothetical protein
MKTKPEPQLVGSAELMRLLWTEDSRPSADWLRLQSRKYLNDPKTGIPCHKPFKDFFYDVDKVRKALGLEGNGK